MRRAGHREIDHTADLGFDVWAPSLEELFGEAILALGDVCYDREAVRSIESRTLSVRGDNPEELLVRWLQDAYLLLEGELWLTAGARNVRCTPRGVDRGLHGGEGELHGDEGGPHGGGELHGDEGGLHSVEGELHGVEGVLHGEPYDAARHTLHTEIKAITYHRMEIRRRDDAWRTTVIVDV